MKIDIKALSVNECWRGRRFKTKKYLDYEKQLLFLLKPKLIPEGNLRLYITFGLSNSLSDVDNGLKPFIDILQKKYAFNDRDIFELHVKKIKVYKGSEFIKFDICSVTNLLQNF